MASATELRQLHGDVTRDKRTVPGETTVCVRWTPPPWPPRRHPSPRGQRIW